MGPFQARTPGIGEKRPSEQRGYNPQVRSSSSSQPFVESGDVIVNNEEPWVDINEYHRISVFLDKEETLQLIIGHSTVQIWRSLPKGEKSDKKGAASSQKKTPPSAGPLCSCEQT